jgi:adenylyltransferase/sulfurtransferase
MLSNTEKIQYSRQLRMPGFGEAEQLRLKSAHVLVVGLGGLGIPVAHYLAAAGIGKLTLVDFDEIELHNIHRQLLFGSEDCGKKKAEVVAVKLKRLYPDLGVDFRLMPFGKIELSDLIPELNLIADCTDNMEARYALDERGETSKIPVMFGAVHRMEGQLSLFHGKAGTRYSDVYPSAPTSTLTGNCREEGILGPVAGTIGTMMATSIIQYIATGNTRADGRLIRYDASLSETFTVEIEARGIASNKKDIQSIEIRDIDFIRIQNPDLQLIDVREQHEHEEHNLGGICRPAGEVLDWLNELNHGSSVILYCHSGFHSYAVARVLSLKRPDLIICHLKHGIIASHAQSSAHNP